MSRSTGLVLVLAGLSAACSSSSVKLKGQYDGTMAMSADGALLYTANADTGTVTVVDSSQRQVVATVAVGQNPARVIVGPDDTLYVSNRGSRSVSVIHRGTWSVASTINVGAEPIGLALSNDATTLYVVNSASGTLDAIDLTTPANTTRWEATLGDDPHGVAVLTDGRLYVSHYKSGLIDVVDGASGTVVRSIDTHVGVSPPASSTSSFGLVSAGTTAAPTFRSIALDSVVVSHDGSRAYLVHRRDREGVVRTTQPAGYYTAIIATTPVVAPAITTVDTTQDVALDDNTSGSLNYPSPVIFPATTVDTSGFSGGGTTISATPASGGASGSAYGSTPFASAPWTQGPVASVEDPQGQFLYVANQNSNDVSVVAAQTRSSPNSGDGILGLVQVGAAPTGLALSLDQKTLFVHNSLDYSISVVESVGGVLAEVDRITVSSPGNLDAEAVEGRVLFFSAADPVMTVPGGGVACESCHLEASSDGTVWQFTHGPRKTPSLLGRHIKDTAPYHWDGTESQFPDFFAETVVVRMGGLGVSDEQSSQLQTYMQGLQTPDNPFRQTGGGLTAAQSRGQALFAGKAACIACHTGADFTDNAFHDVGTFVSANPNGEPDDSCRLTPGAGPCIGTGPSGQPPTADPANTVHGFNTPSLLGVVWAAPYLHDGSAATLADRIVNNPGNVHGNTSALTSDEVSDLVSYIQTL